MQYYKFDSILSSSFYLLSRETSKRLFFRSLKPNVQEEEYAYFDLNNPIIDTDVSEHKILKSKCRMTPLEPHEIDLINNSIRYHYCYYYPIENHIINHYRYYPIIKNVYKDPSTEPANRILM